MWKAKRAMAKIIDIPPDQDFRPIPDPTRLTTEALQREIAALKELLLSRLDAMDKAIRLLESQSDKQPTAMSVLQQVQSLDALSSERFKAITSHFNDVFKAIENQFVERDVRTANATREAKAAVDAALQAQRDAVARQNDSDDKAIAKSEAAVTKQIDNILVLITSSAKGMDDKINDLKDRITKNESSVTGKSEGVSSVGTMVLGGVTILAGTAAIISVIVAFAMR